jgi:hypothetical protein
MTVEESSRRSSACSGSASEANGGGADFGWRGHPRSRSHCPRHSGPGVTRLEAVNLIIVSSEKRATMTVYIGAASVTVPVAVRRGCGLA